MTRPNLADSLRPRSSWPALWSRRDLLRIGPLGLAASVLPAEWARARDAGPEIKTQPLGKARSVIFLWMAGGVTHLDSFDPKPDAPRAIRGTLGTIATSLPGVRFTEVMPGLARLADRLALVRSYSHDSNDHFLSQAYALSGRKVALSEITSEPNIGAIVARLHGPRNGLPGYIAVPGTTRPGPPPYNLFVGGWLGADYAPFAVGGEPAEPDFTAAAALAAARSSRIDRDLQPAALELPADVSVDRLGNRQSLRRRLDAALRDAEIRGAAKVMDAQYRSAFRMLTAPAIRKAFELAREPAVVRDAYGRTKIGQRCLLARRLVEAGARFVMVDYGYDPEYGNLWDNHCVPSQHQPHISEMAKRPYHLAGMDRAFAALLSDLAGRGLLDETLVVFMTEFGRTPKINAYGGRDHWGAAGSIFFAGGGARGGQVIGGTDRQGAFPIERRSTPADVAATVYHAIGVDPNTLLSDRQNRPQAVLPQGAMIPGVLS